MRKIPNLTALAFSLFLLAACNNNDVAESVVEPDVPETPQDDKIPLNVSTRAVDNAAIEGVGVGLFMQPYQSGKMADLLPTYNYINNVEMTYKNGAWRTAAPIYWYDATTLSDIYAYAPYQKGMSDCRKMVFNCSTDQTTDAALAQADLLWGRSLALDPTRDDISVSLNHQLARVNVRIIPEDDFDEGELKASDVKVWIGNLRCDAVMDMQTGDLQVSGEARSIAMHNNGDLTFSAIVLPQTVGFVNLIHVEWGDVSYTLQGSMTFESQRVYDLTVRINKVEASGLNVGISGWDIDEKDYGGTVE